MLEEKTRIAFTETAHFTQESSQVTPRGPWQTLLAGTAIDQAACSFRPDCSRLFECVNAGCSSARERNDTKSLLPAVWCGAFSSILFQMNPMKRRGPGNCCQRVNWRDFLTKYAAQSHTTVMEGSKFEPKRQRHRIGPWRWNVGRHKVPNSAAAAAATVVAVGSKRKR